MNSMKIIFERTAYEKVQQLVTQCPKELMGLGKTRVIGTDMILVEDIVTFEQEVTSAHCELDKDKLMDFIFERTKEPYKDASQWRLWWHSHATMGTFWSGTDESNIARMGETADWMVSVVFNHKMEYEARLDMWKPFCVGPVSMDIQVQAPQDIIDWAKNEIATKIKERTYTEPKRAAGYSSPYYDKDEEGWPTKKENPTDGKIKTIDVKDKPKDGSSIILPGGALNLLDELDEDGPYDSGSTNMDDKSWNVGTQEWIDRVDECKELLITGGNNMLSTQQRAFVTRFWEEFRGLFN